MSKTVVGTTGPKESWPIAVHVRPNGHIEAFFMANWTINVVIEPRYGNVIEHNIGNTQPGFRWLYNAARDYIRDRQLPNPTLTPRTQGEPMTAKSIVNLVSTPRTAPRSYPWVGAANTGTIILFVAPGAGTVIGITAATGGAAQSTQTFGSYSGMWSEEACREFTGTVTISN